jgi:hypothetical protein
MEEVPDISSSCGTLVDRRSLSLQAARRSLHPSSVRRVLFIALVVVVVETGLPVLMGMGGMAFCADCGPGVLVTMTCLATLAAAGFALPLLLAWWARGRRYRELRSRLLPHLLERPPQLITA